MKIIGKYKGSFVNKGINGIHFLSHIRTSGCYYDEETKYTTFWDANADFVDNLPDLTDKEWEQLKK